MIQPQGFLHINFPNHVCKLNKSLYGLNMHLIPRFHDFNSYLLSLDFTCSLTNSSMFILHTSKAILILLLYMNDNIFTRSSLALLCHIIYLLFIQFSVKDFGDLYCFLGQRPCRLQPLSFFFNRLTKFNLKKSKPVRTSPPLRISLLLTDGKLFFISLKTTTWLAPINT